MLGDFNFPNTVVTWEKSNAGIVPNSLPGDNALKRSYELLESVIEKEGMEQIVDKPTRDPRPHLHQPTPRHNAMHCDERRTSI